MELLMLAKLGILLTNGYRNVYINDQLKYSHSWCLRFNVPHVIEIKLQTYKVDKLTDIFTTLKLLY